MTTGAGLLKPRKLGIDNEETLANEGKISYFITSLKVFDVYTGKQVEAGYKSMAFNLTFQADDRTLTDEEIDAVIKNVVEKVGEAYKAKLRD